VLFIFAWCVHWVIVFRLSVLSVITDGSWVGYWHPRSKKVRVLSHHDGGSSLSSSFALVGGSPLSNRIRMRAVSNCTVSEE